MNLSPLIKGQSIMAHTHAWGGRECAGWGHGVHLHKKFRNHERKRCEAIYPLDSNQEPYLRGNVRPDDLGRINREIRNAFKEPAALETFVGEIAKTVDTFSYPSTVRDPETVLINAREAAKRVAEYFGLNQEIEQEIVRRVKERVVMYASLHWESKERLNYIIRQKAGMIAVGPAGKVLPVGLG